MRNKIKKLIDGLDTTLREVICMVYKPLVVCIVLLILLVVFA